MSDPENDKENVENEGVESAEPILSGKGWAVLVGGEENLAALGGSDPFDLEPAGTEPPTTPARSASMSESTSTSSEQPIDPQPRDLSPEELGYQPDSSPQEPVSAGGEMFVDMPTETEDAPTAMLPGISPGVTVIPIEPSIIEVPPSESLPPLDEVPSVSPDAPVIGGPVVVPEGQVPEDVLSGPIAPLQAEPVLSTPAASPWPIPQGVPIHDPFDTQSNAVYGQTDLGGSELPPDGTLSKMLITAERVNALWDEINETYDLVVNDVRGHFETTQQAIEMLKKARELLLSGHENFDNAEKLVIEVKSRLRLEEKVRQWSATRGVWLATYLVLCLLLLSIGSLTTGYVQTFAMQFVPDWMADTWAPGLFGGLGGVVGALWVLNKHITKKRDFDPIHTMWYVTNPILGIALGVGTYIIVRGGGWVLTSVAASGDFNMTVPLRLTLAAICFVVGFNQNVLWALVDRFVTAVIPSSEEKEQAATNDTGASSAAGPTG
ncbi:MAG: hypothetical protein JXB07_09560 [Anaerolineae bacterium]|nr:hypothetical protein [Anaerolineae bacterium]